MENKKDYCTLYLVRHGETEFNSRGILQGHVDSPLTPSGIKQIESIRDNLKDVKFSAVFSSDLGRTIHTAEIIKIDKEILTQTSKILRERSFGPFDGKHVEEYAEALREKFIERSKLTEEEQGYFKLHEDIETDEEVSSRFILKLREISLAYPGKNVLVASHGGTLRTTLIKIGYANRQELPGGSIKNAAYIKLACDGVNLFVKETEGISKRALGSSSVKMKGNARKV